MVKRRRKILDDDGVEVVAGCTVHFGYGTPGVAVRAKVIDRDGRLIALTPGHNPTECPVDHLARNVGNFWVVPDA